MVYKLHRYSRFCYLLLAVMLLTLTGCDHKELYMIDSNLTKVNIAFDYSKVDRIPSAMRVLFYPIQKDSTIGSPLMFDIDGAGGYVSLPEGDYRVLSYNVDNENIIEVNDNDFSNFLLTTSSTHVEVEPQGEDGESKARLRALFGQNLPKAEGEREYLLYDEPDWTCRCAYDRFHVDPPTMTTRTDESLPEATPSLLLTAEPAQCIMEFDVTGIEGLSRASYVRATISGVAASYLMATGRPSSESGMVSFSCKIEPETGLVHGSVRLWGYQPENVSDVQQYLNIYVWASSGNYYFTNDVTDSLAEAQSGESALKIVHFDVEALLDLTQGTVGDSGFQPTIGDWGHEYRGINM